MLFVVSSCSRLGARPWLATCHRSAKRAFTVPQAGLGKIPGYDMRKLRVSYSRSGGPGGQNVNKVETKVEMRISLDDLQICAEAMQRLRKLVGGRVNSANELVVTSSETRSRKNNYDACVTKLAQFVQTSLVEPKPWNKNSKTKHIYHQRRLEEKRRNSRQREMRRVKHEDW